MRSRNEEWRLSAASGRFEMQAKAIIGSTEYTTISAPVISRPSTSGPLNVGECNSATLSFSILTDDEIPKSALVEIKARITDGIRVSEWKTFGKFYVNHRDTSHAGLITLSCYDSMLKANQPYIQSVGGTTVIEGDSWPKPMATVVSAIAQRIGVEVDSRTVINTGSDYVVGYPNSLTMKQILEYIGACHGGNWVITEENKLRLVPLHPSSATVVDVKAVLGDYTVGKRMTITGVSMETDTGEYLSGGRHGAVIALGRNPYATTGICDALYAGLNGSAYTPFSATKAILDPAFELGDSISIGSDSFSAVSMTKLTLDVGYFIDLSVPGNEELNDEYPYLTEKQIRENAEAELAKGIAETKSSLIVERNRITAEVSRAESAENALSSRLEIAEGGVALIVQEGSISSALSMESDQINISSGRIGITSTNFILDHNGNVTAHNLVADGRLTSGNNNTDTVDIFDGAVKFLSGGTLLGQLKANTSANPGTGGATRGVVDLETDNYGTIFSIGSKIYVILDNGVNNHGHTERFQVTDTMRVSNVLYCGSYIQFDGDEPGGGHEADLFLDKDENILGTYASAWVGGDFNVRGTKNRIVETDHYGHVALNAMESAAAVFSDMGSGTIDETGICEVFFDSCFSETIDSLSDYITQINQIGRGRIDYTEKENGCFIVYGAPGSRFDWVVYAKQKDYTDLYLKRKTVPERCEQETDDTPFAGDDIAAGSTEQYMGEFVDSLDELAVQYLNEYEREVGLNDN